MVFRSIVSQLAKENEKFMYGAVREGGRAREFEEAIEWLVSAGMLNRVYNVSKMEHPLAAFDRLDQFKLFVFDAGLLKYISVFLKRLRGYLSMTMRRLCTILGQGMGNAMSISSGICERTQKIPEMRGQARW